MVLFISGHPQLHGMVRVLCTTHGHLKYPTQQAANYLHRYHVGDLEVY